VLDQLWSAVRGDQSWCSGNVASSLQLQRKIAFEVAILGPKGLGVNSLGQVPAQEHHGEFIGLQALVDDVRRCRKIAPEVASYYLQSNGKVRSWHKIVNRKCIRPKTPLTIEDARRIAESFVSEYDTLRLHSRFGHVTPQARFEGRDQDILAERRRKLAAARLARDAAHQPAWVETRSELSALAVA
jgi:hypothetical protein